MTSRRTTLASAASLGLLAAARHAVGQRPGKVFRIGYLSLRSRPNAQDEAFVQRLRELGYRKGDNLLIDYRWADEDLSLLERQADELVRLPVDVIVTAQVPAVRIAKKATTASSPHPAYFNPRDSSAVTPAAASSSPRSP